MKIEQKSRLLTRPSEKFWFDVARMSHAYTSRFLDVYEASVDEIVASCNGDLRGAVRALMLANEQLERRLQCISAELVGVCQMIRHVPRVLARHSAVLPLTLTSFG